MNLLAFTARCHEDLVAQYAQLLGQRRLQDAHQLMTPQERETVHEKMRNAKSPEERQTLAAPRRAEMEKRAKDEGITLPEHGGMGHLRGMGGGAPADGEHKH